MTDTQPSISRLVSMLSNRLRLMQADLADRPLVERQEILAAEVRRETHQLHPAQSRAVIDQLIREFPTWANESAATEPVAPTGPTEEEWNNPAALIAQLAVVTGKEPARRKQVLDLLKSRGLVAATLPEKSAAALGHALQLPAQMPIDPVRTVELVLVLMDFIRKQESFILGVWSTAARGIPNTFSSRSIAEIVARYISLPDTHPQRASMKQELDAAITLLDRRVRVFAATLRAYAQEHSEKFAPAEIENMVTSSFLTNKNKVLWDRYIELCGGPDREHLEAEVRLMQTAIIQRIWSTV